MQRWTFMERHSMKKVVWCSEERKLRVQESSYLKCPPTQVHYNDVRLCSLLYKGPWEHWTLEKDSRRCIHTPNCKYEPHSVPGSLDLRAKWHRTNRCVLSCSVFTLLCNSCCSIFLVASVSHAVRFTSLISLCSPINPPPSHLNLTHCISLFISISHLFTLLHHL